MYFNTKSYLKNNHNHIAKHRWRWGGHQSSMEITVNKIPILQRVGAQSCLDFTLNGLLGGPNYEPSNSKANNNL